MLFEDVRKAQAITGWQRRVIALICIAAFGCFGVIANTANAKGQGSKANAKINKKAPVVWPCATSGDDGTAEIANRHGTETLLSSGEYVDACKFVADATITSAIARKNGVVIVRFTVMDKDGHPVFGVPSVTANIAKLVPASGGESFNQWVPYVYRTEAVGAGSFPNPAGTTVEQGYRESNGIFTDHRDGSYTYKFATNIAKVMTPVTGTPITYDRSLTHRVSIMMGGHSGPTADAVLDFVPDGSVVEETRNIVETTSCYTCHGENEFHGHGGDRLTVENCVTCHNPGGTDAQGGETLDMKVMIHKIHAGGELATIPGPDGVVWDNPGTMADESADNGEYAIWGFRNSKHEWWKAEFPAVIENCTKCHQGAGANVDNWKEVPSRDTCSSCHDDVDFASGVNHAGGAQSSDAGCGFCHAPDGPGYPPSVADAHDWTTKDQRNIPEFDIDLTVSTPGNGTHFVAGESPMVSIVINDGGTPIDHTTAVKDTDGREGCADPDACPPADGKFDHIYLMVHGPRAERAPVLSTAARADIVSGSAGPFDLSTAASLELRVDNEVDISVDMDLGAFVDPFNATPMEIVDWLNADASFFDAAIAYMEEGNVAIRSRNIGKFFALQLETSDVNTVVFGGDTSIYVPGGFYPRNDVAIMADPADDDPKADWFVEAIDYNLDPVDDLRPGTYIASVEITDRGRINGSNYKTPSVAKTLFQVKQAEEELAPAGNCGRCHQGPDGTGFILDFGRHNKIFDDTAVDQCGACHDYQNQNATGGWSGARPISKRVHAVHHGSELNYPLVTVDYSNGDPVPGRDWDIEFPQDIRNCETCHPAGTTSGSWKTEPSRLPCSGCHDADETTAHITLMTYDPSPADPWNGDEEESCKVCH
jgi:predicted CXXCH cytochrome family protein